MSRPTMDERRGAFHEGGWARVTVWGGGECDCPECARKALRAVGIERGGSDGA